MSYETNLQDVCASTVERLFLALDNKMNKEAKFSPAIKLIPALITHKGQDNSIKGSDVFHDGVWMPISFHEALSRPPKYFVESEGDIKESDLKEIEKKIGEISGTLDLKKHLPELKKLSANYFSKPSSETSKALMNKWREIEQENKAAVASREKALTGLEKLIGNSLAEKVKTTLLCLPEPKEALEYIKANFKNVRQKQEKEKEKGFVPEFDAKKKEFTKEDIEYILKVIKEKYKAGLDGIINPLKKLFNGDLINSLVLAYRKYQGVEGLVDFLKHYDTKKDQLSKSTPYIKLPANLDEILSPTEEILDFLKEIKSVHSADYKNSFFEYTEDILKLLLKYVRNREKITLFEELFTEVFITGVSGDDAGVVSQWSELRYPDIYNKLKKIRTPVSILFKNPENKKVEDVLEHLESVGRGERKMVELDEDESNPYVRDIAKLINNIVYVSEDDKELMKEIKNVDKGIVKDVTEKDLSEEEIKEKRKKYRDYQKKIKEKEEQEKFELMSPKEQLDYKLQKKNKEKEKEEAKKERSEKTKQRAKEKAEKLKSETKKSSYLPLFTKFETLSNRAQNPLVKAELGAILDTLKIVL